MAKIRCLIVEDEPLAQQVLDTYIKKIDQLELVAKCDNALDAFKMLNQEDIDLIFLDIQMPEMTGIEFLKSIKNPPQVIFTTAYPEFAVEGFNLDALDYLLKPIAFDRFLRAINKVLHNPNEQAAESTDNDYIFVKTDKKIVKIELNSIRYIEGLKDYVMIYTEDTRHIALMTMKGLEANLPAGRFMRIHKSYILNTTHIKSIMGNSVEVANKMIPIGKIYREVFFEMVEKRHLHR